MVDEIRMNGLMDGWMNSNPVIHSSKNPVIQFYESSSIGEEALRKLQDHTAQGRHPRDLHQQAPQAAPGVENWSDGVMDYWIDVNETALHYSITP